MATYKEMASVNGVEVVTILANDIILCKNWRLFCRILKFEQSVMYTFDRMESSNSSFFDLIISIMDHWESMSPADANVENLSKILREIKCAKSADDINALLGLSEKKLTSDFQSLHVSSTSQLYQAVAPHSNSNTTETGLIWFNIRSPTTFYTGREIEMQIITKQWKECEKQKRILFVCITGLGGIGKSELARNYAKMFHESIKGHSIWIDAETDQTISQNFQLLAPSLGISQENNSGKVKSQNILITEIYEKLCNEKCLIIFDNLESYQNSILTLLINIASKKSPTTLRPFVLVTSRYRPAIKFLGDNCISLELNVLSKESALKFFSKSFNLTDQDSTPVNTVNLLIGKLGQRLHFYPLAMQQAAAYIKESLFNKSTNNLEKEIEKYLDDIEEESKTLLDHKLPQAEALDDISKTTFLVWGITLDKIRRMPEIGGTAVKMMDIISFLSPDNISTEFLMILFEEQGNPNPKVNTKSYEVLRDHSMISLSENKISIHRLVQDVTRIQLIEEGKFTDCLDQILTGIRNMLIKNEIQSYELIHAQIIWGHASGNREFIEKHGSVPGWICQRLFDAGKYRLIDDFSCRTLSDLETTVGKESRWTLKIKHWKGWALRELGEYSKSLEVLNEVNEKQKKLFGVEDVDVLFTANEIGGVHRQMKNYNEALKCYEDSLEISERLNGKEHSETLVFKHNIALVLYEQGKYKEAMEMYKDVLSVKERILGNEDPSTLITKFNLATVRCKLEEYEDALTMLKEVLKVQERVINLDHPNTLLTKGWMSETYQCLGKMNKALQLAKEVHEKRVKVLGPTHPDTILAKDRVERFEMTLNTLNIKRTDQRKCAIM